jgi:hypothetical protein
MRKLIVVAVAVIALTLTGNSVAAAGPAANGSALTVSQFGVVTHRVCDNHSFELLFFSADPFDLAGLSFDVVTPGGGLVFRGFILIGGGDGGSFAKKRIRAFGPGADGKYRIRFTYQLPEDPPRIGSYSIQVVPCGG